jgi:hypothetical protein
MITRVAGESGARVSYWRLQAAMAHSRLNWLM